MAPGLSRLARPTIVVPVLALVSVIAHGVFGVGRDTTRPTHSLRNAQACLECHLSFDDYRLSQPVPTLCARCHALEDLSSCKGPTGPHEGDCTRCHDVHGKTREPSLLWESKVGAVGRALQQPEVFEFPGLRSLAAIVVYAGKVPSPRRRRIQSYDW